MKTIELIKAKRRSRFVTIWDYIPALLSNGFSILFASSIVFELINTLSGVVLIILFVFAALFLIYNEVVKVNSVRRFFKGTRGALIPLLVTFIISIVLATIGMYFWTNKSTCIIDTSNIEKFEAINRVKSTYGFKVTEVSNKSFETSLEYATLNQDLNYWKSRSSASLEERNEIRDRINRIQLDIQKQRIQFNYFKKFSIDKINDLMNQEIAVIESKYTKNVNGTKKNDFITYIFLSLIFITEFATIMLNKHIAEKQLNEDNLVNSELAKEYVTASSMVTELYVTKTIDGTTNLNKAKYSRVALLNKIEWDNLKVLYNRFIDLGILDRGSKIGDLISNKFLVTDVEAQKMIDNYYEKLMIIS